MRSIRSKDETVGMIWTALKQAGGDFWDEFLLLIIFNAVWLLGSLFLLPWPYLTFGLFYTAYEVGQGKAIKFHENECRPMGRTAAGVKGIRLGKKDRIISMVVAGDEEKFVFTASQKGYGKKTEVDAYPCHHRGGQGVINLKVNDRIGKAVGMVGIQDHEMLLIT